MDFYARVEMSYDEDSCIHEYHLYQSIRTAVESLVCEREPLNSMPLLNFPIRYEKVSYLIKNP